MDIKEELKIPILCYDPIFKSIFMKHPHILSKFIYDITGDKLDNITLVSNELPIIRNKEKFKRCDFIIKDNNKIYNIELNSSYSKTLLIKNTSYIFNLFSANTSIGEKYNKDLEVIQININNFSRFNRPVLDYQIMNSNYYSIYLDSLKIYDLDIVKCNNLYYNDRVRKRNYLKWGALFSCTTIEDMIPILDNILTKKESDRMVEDLYNLEAPGKVISEAEALRLDDMFRRSLREEGLEEGIEKGIEKGTRIGIEEGKKQKTIDMIKSMLKKSMSYSDINDITGSSIEEIKEIEKSIKL